MGKFLRNFGLGLVYIFLLPLLLAILALGAVAGLFIYIFVLFRSLIRFFRGEKIFPTLEEDLLVKQIEEERLKEELPKETPKEKAEPSVSNVYIQQNYYTNSPNSFPNPNVSLPPYQNLNNQQLPPRMMDAEEYLKMLEERKALAANKIEKENILELPPSEVKEEIESIQDQKDE